LKNDNTKDRRNSSAEEDLETSNKLAGFIAENYVRMDGKYYDVHDPTKKFARPDVQRACVHRLREAFPETPIPTALLADAFKAAFVDMRDDWGISIPIWNGKVQCLPGNPEVLVQTNGMVSINSWRLPKYRLVRHEPRMNPHIWQFLTTIFPDEGERETFLNWLAWCLQNEGRKPTWGPVLYSKRKGTGKSTLCLLMERLFGEENSIMQNGAAKLTGRFNREILTKKLVISEELQITPGSAQANALKSLMTETEAATEAKGRELEKIQQYFCAIFTTNHLPMWIEESERRFWVVEVDHDGHSGGPSSERFTALVGVVRGLLQREEVVGSLHSRLMERQLPAWFSGLHFNNERCSTALMQRIIGNSSDGAVDAMKEYVDVHNLVVLPDKELQSLVTRELKLKASAAKHLMTEIGWNKVKVKWDGKDFTRALWVHPDCGVSGGKVHLGGGGKEVSLRTALGRVPDDQQHTQQAAPLVEELL
jgi:hypothetical protein